MRGLSVRRALVGIVAAGVIGGCARASVVDTALHGDLKQLQADVESARTAGDLDEATVRRLARAVARREIASSKGDAALDRIADARTCARPIKAALSARAEVPDEAGAAATEALLGAGLIGSEDLVERYARADSGAWRAVAARAATAPELSDLRQSFYRDGDERVRRAALSAALTGASAGEVPALLEAARLDPDPLSRSLAARALGAVGGEPVVLGLRDLYPRAEPAMRLSLIGAWAQEKSLASGGENQLLWVLESTSGLSAIAAAGELARAKRFEAQALALLGRSIDSGTSEERRLAMRLAPPSNAEVARAMWAAADATADPASQIIALARLINEKAHQRAARERLLALANLQSADSIRARAALAVIGEPKVATLLTADLKAARPWRRRTAAVGLLRMGRFADAALGLSDADPAVRMSVACAILASR